MRNRRAGLAFIFITLLIDVLGVGLIIPILPGLVTSLAGGPSTGARLLGLLVASFGLMQFLFAPVLGGLSDRYGRRPVLLVSLFFTAVDYVVMALAPSIGWLFLGRILAGITSASFTAAAAYIADVSPPEKRAQNFGLIGAAVGLGFIIGPAVGGLLGAFSLRAPFWAAAALSLLNGLYGLFVLPESLAPENRRPFSLAANPFGALGLLARHEWVKAIAWSLALQGLAQHGLQSTWVLYTTYRFRWSELDNGLSLAAVGLANVIVQVGLIRVLVPRLGENRAVLWGLLCCFLGYVGLALASQVWMLVVILLVWSLSFIVGPTTQSMLSRQYGADEQGSVQGALASLQSLTGIVGPLIFTWVFGYFTSRAAPVPLPSAPFFLGAALIALAAVVASRALRRRPEAAVEAPKEEME